VTTAAELDLIRIQNLPENDTSLIVLPENLDSMSEWLDSRIDILIPDKIIVDLPSKWNEQKRVLPEGINRLPGAYSYSVNPYMKTIVDCLHPNDPTEIIDLMKGAQITWTTGCLVAAIGWNIDECPGPIMYITGSERTAKKNMETKIDRMIQEAGIGHKIFAQVEKKANKRSGDTSVMKEFPGGSLIASGPNSGANLRDESVQYLYIDEADAAETELVDGNYIDVAFNRTNSFEGVRKVLCGSTPLLKENSRIYPRFLKGTQEYYNVPCKKCNKLFVLDFFPDENGRGGLRFDKKEDGKLDEKSVRYHCPHCDHQHKNEDKVYLLSELRGAKWIATAEPETENRRSFHLNSLYAPLGFESWETIAKKWNSAQGDMNALKSFYNTTLGLPWENRTNAPTYEKIMIRRSGYTTGQTPPNFKPLIYVGGADVQGDRIEAHVIGFGRIQNADGSTVGKIAASIVYEQYDQVGHQDTSDISFKPWRELDDLIGMTIGGKPIMSFCIDAGYRTDTVYEFCSGFQSGVYPVMGSNGSVKKSEIFRKTQVKQYGIDRIDVNTDYFKQEIYNNSQKTIYETESDGKIIQKIPHGYFYFPDDYPEDFYKGLFSEYRTEDTDKHGYKKWVWKKLSTARRNEELDTTVYAYLALYIHARAVFEESGRDQIDWNEYWEYLEAENG